MMALSTLPVGRLDISFLYLSLPRQIDSHLSYLPFLCIKKKKKGMGGWGGCGWVGRGRGRRQEESLHALLH